MWSKRLKIIVLILLAILGMLIGGLYLNSDFYHLWLADGPPVADPEYHFNLFFQHLGIALSGLAVSVVAFIYSWKRRSLRNNGN